MSPVELTFSVNGEEKETVKARDGVMARLNTPAGVALAKLEPQGESWIDRTPTVDRLGTRFPDDPEFVTYATRADGLHYRINSLFDPLFPKIRKLLKAEKPNRRRTISTAEGEVTIKATGYDQE